MEHIIQKNIIIKPKDLYDYIYDHINFRLTNINKLYIIDIYGTLLKKNKNNDITINNKIYNKIIKWNKDNNLIILLSYDTKYDRINEYIKLLNSYEPMDKIIKIFIDIREKGIVINTIINVLKNKNIKINKLYFYDDNYKNISNLTDYIQPKYIKTIYRKDNHNLYLFSSNIRNIPI